MQMTAPVIAALLLRSAFAVVHNQNGNPIEKVIKMLDDMKGTIEDEGKDEASNYDKFACYCEDTMSKTTKSIADNKDKIEKLQKDIESFKGTASAKGADAANLKKQVAETTESISAAEETRQKENEGYVTSRTEAEQCIGALEAAIKTLTGAGTGTSAIQEAQLLSAAAGVRGVLKRPFTEKVVQAPDLEVVRSFVSKPESFVNQQTGFLSVAQNPFGDYAPQSTQIQGILKGMYDSFTTDLESANTEEGEKQKAFEDLMATKNKELGTLQKTLDETEKDESEAATKLADSEEEQANAEKSLASDEELFETTKTNCRQRAGAWAGRSKVRTEEIAAISNAIDILKDGMDNFKESSVEPKGSFLQMHMVTRRLHAAQRLMRKLSAPSVGDVNAEHSVEGMSNKPIDKVIMDMQDMIATLKEEQMNDDRLKRNCDKNFKRNAYEQEDLNGEIEHLEGKIKSFTNEKGRLAGELDTTKDSIKTENDNLAELIKNRNEEAAETASQLEKDELALATIKKAKGALRDFYSAFLQTKAPDAPSGEYGGHQGAGAKVISILDLIQTDLEKTIDDIKEQEAEALREYTKANKDIRSSIKALNQNQIDLEAAKAKSQRNVVDRQNKKARAERKLETAEKTKESLDFTCEWLEEYDTRKTKRGQEVEDLKAAIEALQKKA